jgi:hypothetical protein
MKNLDPSNQVLRQAPEPLGHMRLEVWFALSKNAELLGDLFFSQGVVLEFLRRLGVVYLRRKDVV